MTQRSMDRFSSPMRTSTTPDICRRSCVTGSAARSTPQRHHRSQPAVLPDSGRLLEEQAIVRPPPSHLQARDAPPAVHGAGRARRPGTIQAHNFDDEVTSATGLSPVSSPPVTSSAQPRCRSTHTALGVHFTGDLGRAGRPADATARALEETDVLVIRVDVRQPDPPHSKPWTPLGRSSPGSAPDGGVVLLPAFAVGRAESLLLHLHALRAAASIPEVPVFLNSPMAVDASDIYARHPRGATHPVRDDSRPCTRSPHWCGRSTTPSFSTCGADPPSSSPPAGCSRADGSSSHRRVRVRSAQRHHPHRLPGRRDTRSSPATRRTDLRIYGKDVPIRASPHPSTLSAHADASAAHGLAARVTDSPEGDVRHSRRTRGRPMRCAGASRHARWTASVPESARRCDVTGIARG